jgi:hypothetical protein
VVSGQWSVISGQWSGKGDRLQKKQPVAGKKSLNGLSWFEYALEAGNNRQSWRMFFASVFSELRGKSRIDALTGGDPIVYADGEEGLGGISRLAVTRSERLTDGKLTFRDQSALGEGLGDLVRLEVGAFEGAEVEACAIRGPKVETWGTPLWGLIDAWATRPRPTHGFEGPAHWKSKMIRQFASGLY